MSKAWSLILDGVLLGAMSAVASPHVFAQAINLDLGTYNPAPSSTYGAAPGQAGYWNHVTGPALQYLLDVNGQPTTVSVVSTSSTGWTFGSNDPNTTGDDELLLDGGHDGVNTFTFDGLAPGIYSVYSYCRAPDDPIWSATTVEVPGSSDPVQWVGGLGQGMQWNGVHILHASYAKHRIVLTSGQIQVICGWGTTFATENGFQIVPHVGCSELVSYCTAKVNSAGCSPAISATGTPSASAGSGFVIRTQGTLKDTFGSFFYSKTGPNNAPYQGGLLCVQPSIWRVGLQKSGGTWTCGGSLSLDFNAYIASGTDPALTAGQAVWIQAWSRDPGLAPPNASSLSNAGAFIVCP